MIGNFRAQLVQSYPSHVLVMSFRALQAGTAHQVPPVLGERKEMPERGVRVVILGILDFQGVEEKWAVPELQGVTETRVPLGPLEPQVLLAPRVKGG